MAKRFACVLLVALCALLLMPTLSHAAGWGVSSLTIEVIILDTVAPGVDFTLCRVADLRESGKGYDAAQAFSGARADFSDLATEKSLALAKELDAYATANGIERMFKSANAQGKAVFTQLPAGLYLVTQANAANSEYVVAPYLAAAPIPGDNGEWNYNVITYPKTEFVKGPPVEGISVSVYKVWAGAATHPSSVLAQLYRNGQAHENSVALNADNAWSHVWKDLDPNDTWTVDEVDIPEGYEKSVSGNVTSGFVITNTWKPDTPTTLVSGQKTWKHGANPPGERPQSIIVVVKADDKIVTQRRITAAEHWSWSFRLPTYNAQGEKITYSVDEADIVGYAVTVDGYNLVNTFRGKDPGSPITSDESNLVLWLSLMGFSILGLTSVSIILGRRKRNEKAHA